MGGRKSRHLSISSIACLGLQQVFDADSSRTVGLPKQEKPSGTQLEKEKTHLHVKTTVDTTLITLHARPNFTVIVADTGSCKTWYM
ncbi:hypothetical protein ACFX19_012687 [Malus domestica]